MKNIAVIGCGGQGSWHCKQIMNSNVVTLAGTYDIDPNKMFAAKEMGINLYDSFEAVLADVLQRDLQDSTRAAAPLKQAEDAIRLDTTYLDFDESFVRMKEIILRRAGLL